MGHIRLDPTPPEITPVERPPRLSPPPRLRKDTSKTSGAHFGSQTPLQRAQKPLVIFRCMFGF